MSEIRGREARRASITESILAGTSVFVLGILGLASQEEIEIKAAPTPQESPLPIPTPTPEAQETVLKILPRTIIGNPPDYELRWEDKMFLDWLHAKGLTWTDWEGRRQLIFIPEDVYRDAKTVEEAGGVPWELLTAVGMTETGSFYGLRWDPRAVSASGAMGRFQIMPSPAPKPGEPYKPGTWEIYRPRPNANPFNPKDNAITASNLLVDVFWGQDLETISLAEWVDRFIGSTGGPAWNIHEEQAKATYEIFRKLVAAEQEYQTVQG